MPGQNPWDAPQGSGFGDTRYSTSQGRHGGPGSGGIWGGVPGMDRLIPDKGNRYRFGNAMIGLGQGLMSQRPGENWAGALGRGFNQARANMESAEDDLEREREKARQDSLRHYMLQRSQDPSLSQTDRDMMNVGSMLGPNQAGSLVSQLYSAEQNRLSQQRARKDRLADSAYNRNESALLRDESYAARLEMKAATPKGQNDAHYQAIMGALRGDAASREVLGIPADAKALPPEHRAFLQEYRKQNQMQRLEDEAIGGDMILPEISNSDLRSR
jgi:hypothetical protein